jgi:hypothetical protein
MRWTYSILKASTAAELQDMVQTQLDRGGELAGGLSVTVEAGVPIFYQAIVAVSL